MAMAQRREALTVRDTHAMIALTVTSRSTWPDLLALQHRSRGLLPTNAFFINNQLSHAYPCMSAGASLYRGKDGPQVGT
jgi:hypothetical protein